jgi:hypothetical protein
MRKIFAMMLVGLVVAACEKPVIGEESDDVKGSGNVTLRFNAVGAQTRAANVTIGDYFTKLNVMLFDENGNKYFDKVRTQYSTDENFGQMSLTLPAGEYSVVAVGHSSAKSATIKSP